MSPATDRWSAVKALFWEISDAPVDARDALLASGTDDEQVREEVRRLLAAAGDVGDRFERPAIASLGLHDGRAEARSLVGERVGAYEIVRKIGEGGMGTVYEARRADDAFAQRVALKTVWRGTDDALMARRLRSERRILGALAHPNIARLLDGGTTNDGLPYLVMEYVDGEPIDAWCDARRTPIAERLALFVQACAAVQHAHAQLVIHRDLKPSNVLVAADGTVKLLDFGIAKALGGDDAIGTLTAAGLLPFTAGFAAPEQITGGTVSTATDVYALGALLHVLLTGRAPFDADRLTPVDAMVAIREGAALAPPSTMADDAAAHARALPNADRLRRTLRGELDAIVRMALRREPSRRYATVDALAEDVRRYLRGDRVLARPDTLVYRLRTFARRQRALVLGASVAASALVIGSGIALWQARESRIEAARSERVSDFLTNMLGAHDAHTGDPFARLGPRGTVAELLDAAIPRVARVFPDDPRVRARLYTAMGASLVSQSRMQLAAALLDSARTLARATYGPRSDAYAEASLDAGNAAIHRTTPAAARALFDEAASAIAGRESQSPELHARILVGLSTADLLDGRLRRADSLARAAITLELHRTASPTLARAWAERLLGSTTQLLQADDRGADAHFAHAVAICDSLGMTVAVERIDALFGRIYALFALGRANDARPLVDEGLAAARAGFGTPSRELALFLAPDADLLRASGDFARARAVADSASRIIGALPDVNAAVALVGGTAAMYDHASRHEWAAGDTVAVRTIARVRALGSSTALLSATFVAGLLRVQGGDRARADSMFHAADAIVAERPDLAPVLQRLYRSFGIRPTASR